MSGYTRVDTGNNIADGNVINAADLDNEFDGVQAAFNSSTGHTHDGTSGEGAPITKIGPVQDVVVSISAIYPKTTNTVDLGTSSLKYKDLHLAGNSLLGGTLGVTGAATFTGAIVSDSTTDSTSTLTGAIQTDGGLGVAKALWVGGLANIAGATTLQGTLTGSDATDSTSTVSGAFKTAGGLGVAKALWVGGLANIAGAATLQSTLAVTGVATLTAQPILSSLTASKAVFSDGSKGLVSNDITGTGNVVMSASPTLTGTLTAAALTTSGTVTHNGGTANGVAYLNGSKVLTTGSALVFDGTNLGIGISSPTALLDVYKASQGAYATFRASGPAGQILWANGGASTSYLDSDTTIFRQSAASGNAERMRIDSSGNLLVGTTNAGVGGLGVSASENINFPESATTAYATMFRQSSSAALTLNFGYAWSATSNAWASSISTSTARSSIRVKDGEINFYTDAASTVAVGTNITPTERMRIDSSGNLGLGVTPSAWTTYKGIQVGTAGSASFWGGSGLAAVSLNTFYNGAYTYQANGYACDYYQYAGTHVWRTAASGTAGNAISFTQAMTLDASGRLGVGTTSPDYRIVLSDATEAVMKFNNSGQGYNSWFGSDATGTTIVNDAAKPIQFKTNGTERARIDSSGNVGIGTSSPNVRTEVGGTEAIVALRVNTQNSGVSSSNYSELQLADNGTVRAYFRSMRDGSGATILSYSDHLRISAAGTEKVRIDSSGNLLVGTTTDSGVGVTIKNDSGILGRVLLKKSFSGNTDAVPCYHNSTYVGGIQYSNTATTFLTSSDARLKKDVVDAGSASERIDQIRIVSHGWKHDDAVVEFGMIAQELFTVAPQAVTAGDEGEEVEQTWGIDYAKLVPMLIKAHQEQQAIITSLTARIEALEA